LYRSAAAARPANAPAAQVRKPDADARPEDGVPSEARGVVVRRPPCGGRGQVARVRHVRLVGEDDGEDDAVDGRRLAENDAAGGRGRGGGGGSNSECGAQPSPRAQKCSGGTAPATEAVPRTQQQPSPARHTQLRRVLYCDAWPLPDEVRAPDQVLAAYSGRLDGGTHDGGAGDEDAPAGGRQAEAGSGDTSMDRRARTEGGSYAQADGSDN